MNDQRNIPGLDVLTIGFGATVAMWAVGYVCRLPVIVAPGWLVLPLMVACLVVGGGLAGRVAGRGWKGGAVTGAVSALLNLLILGSVLKVDGGDALRPSALLWIPGSIIASAIIAAAAAAVMRRPGAALPATTWRSFFVLVTASATLLVVIAGGLVTSLEAGLAVPDWPNSFGSNMFLYPLARMTGGVYYEHAHRLYGALVGLCTVVLAIVLWRTDERRWMRVFAVTLVVMVVAQGAMGGLRVTGSFTLSADAADLAPSRILAIIHGVFGQLFFATLGVAWAFTTTPWRDRVPGQHPAASAEQRMSGILLVLVVLQLASGAMYRHLATPESPMPWPAHVHLTLAAIVAVTALLAGLRVWVRYPDDRVLRLIGGALAVSLVVQLLLGFAALVAVFVFVDAAEPPPAEVVIATAHQANGAIVLAIAAQLAVWTRRLLTTGPSADPGG